MTTPLPSQDVVYMTKKPSNIMARMYKRLCVEQQSELDTYLLVLQTSGNIDILEW